jgi:pimeloyl-ACP methyl ester carboxylesterase
MAVVLPDCCNSAHNESAGRAADFTIGDHVRDALRAAEWAIANLGDGGTVCLAGHSMGAYAAGLLAASSFADRCRHLMLVSPFVSGQRQIAARAEASPDALAALGRELPQAFFDWPRHDLLRHVAGIACPAATVVGALDTVTPEPMVRILFDALPWPVTHAVLDGAHHCLEGGPHDCVLMETLAKLEAAAGNRRPAVPVSVDGTFRSGGHGR